MATKAKDGDLYLMQDGTYAAPGDCTAGKDGVLRNKAGLAVCLDDAGEPMTLAAATKSNADAAAAGKKDEALNENAEGGFVEPLAKEAPAKEAVKPAKPA